MTSAITWKGSPVPYVTKWTGEHINDQQIRMVRYNTTPPTFEIAFADPSPMDRDSRGFMWFRDAIGRGSGEPMWRQVHAARQRRCMTRLRCQVCDKQLPGSNIPWLFPTPAFELIGEHPTATPPCCEQCWDVAARLCPRLGQVGAVRAYVKRRDLWGVVGDLYHPDDTVEQGVLVAFASSDAMIRMTLAKQMAVTLHGVTEA